ncbi:hypothetical protein ACVW0J_003375 [Bradyrhizobium sp. i1.7.7]
MSVAVGDMADAGRDRRAGAAGRAARGQRGIAGVLGVAMDQIGGEPAIGEGRAIGAAKQDGARFAEIGDHRIVLARDQVALEFQAVGGGKAFLVDIGLDGDGHAGEHTGIVSPGDGGIDGISLLEHVLRPVVDHRVELGIDGVQAGQTGLGRLPGGDLFGFDEGSEVGGRQAPEILHGLLRLTGVF